MSYKTQGVYEGYSKEGSSSVEKNQRVLKLEETVEVFNSTPHFWPEKLLRLCDLLLTSKGDSG